MAPCGHVSGNDQHLEHDSAGPLALHMQKLPDSQNQLVLSCKCGKMLYVSMKQAKVDVDKAVAIT